MSSQNSQPQPSDTIDQQDPINLDQLMKQPVAIPHNLPAIAKHVATLYQIIALNQVTQRQSLESITNLIKLVGDLKTRLEKLEAKEHDKQGE